MTSSIINSKSSNGKTGHGLKRPLNSASLNGIPHFLWDQVPLGIIIFTECAQEGNSEACRLLGVTSEALGKSDPFSFSPELQPCGTPSLLLAAARKESALAGDSLSFIWRVRRSDGYEYDAEMTLAPGASAANGAGLILFMRDISRERQSDNRLKMLSRAIDQVSAIVFLTDTDGRVEYVNAAFGEIMGYRLGEIIGQNTRILGAAENDPELFAELWKTITAGKDWRGQIRNRTKHGTLVWIETIISPIRSEDGSINHYLAVGRDITNQKHLEEEHSRLQQQLQQAHKMEALGTLAGGVAHDFNNILAAIYGFATLARKDLPADSLAAENLDRLLNTASHGRDLVRQILSFSRSQETRPVLTRLDQSATEAIDFLKHTLPSSITIVSDYPEIPFLILADPIKIHQVFVNLATNAAHAMSAQGGTLTIQIRALHLDPVQARRFHKLKAGDYLRLSVSDTGHGMDEAVRSRIFDPFFTTKKAGEGTGLGLSVVHGIIAACGGHISVYSEPGVGTAFHILFPVAQAESGTNAPVHMTLRRGSERILYIDDEEAISSTQAQILRELGYSVDVSMEPGIALVKFAAAPDAYDIVITDQTMPRMTGIELATQLKKIRSDVPVILTTGFSSHVTPKALTNAGIGRALMKPVFLGDLCQALVDLLGPGKLLER